MTTQFLKNMGMVDDKGKIDFIAFFERFGVLIFLILLIIFFTSQNGAFLSQRNIYNVLTEVSIFGIMAVGMTFVILTAGIESLCRLNPCCYRNVRGLYYQRR